MLRRFGRCELDLASRELRRDGKLVHVSPKAFELLKLLIERSPAAISKEEIYAAVWSSTFVSDASLTNVVAEIRAAIGDPARKPVFVRTVHGFGYAFAGEAFEPPAPARREAAVCRLALGNRRFPLSEGSHVIGREPDAGVLVDHASVSRRHALVTVTCNDAVLEDLQSRNGTFVNGQRIETPTELRDGDVIGLGPVTLVVEKASWSGSTKTDLAR